MLDIPSISAVVAAVGVLVGVVFTYLEVRNLVTTRKTDLVMRLHSAFSRKEFVEAAMKLLSLDFEDYNDFVNKFGPFTSETPVNTAWVMVGSYYEAIGVLLEENLIDVDVVFKLVPVSVMWEKMRPIAEGQRKEMGPSTWAWFEYLYNEMQKRRQRLQPTQQ